MLVSITAALESVKLMNRGICERGSSKVVEGIQMFLQNALNSILKDH